MRIRRSRQPLHSPHSLRPHRPRLTGPGAALLGAAALLPLAASATATTGSAPPAAPTRVVDLSTAAQLKDALAAARPGDRIQLADGTYHGNFTTAAAGTASSRITLTGSSQAVLTTSGGYGLYLNGAPYWTVQGIAVTGARKGS
ncbi:hypothetical protein AB0C96_28680 [Streptomyces sp. NPDC048506]|uniref:hypothetical protein n=1 Tax=Streptomyces sp. NPDC048506 TaxID=3155028 RepID=UPI00341E2344